LKYTPQDSIYSLVDYEKSVGYDYDLDAYKNFLAGFGNPQEKLKNVILIGGTKGKGSTAAILGACLVKCGYKVGLYSSPHLIKLNERIKINNRNISDPELEGYTSRIMSLIKKQKRARSFFEALTTIAFLHFLERQVDFTILEVGLGGRLDATNATDPIISVITRIGYDHTNLLGTTLSQITGEKAGIIRQNGKLITLHQRPDAEKILRRVAQDRKSIIIFADEQHHIEVTQRSLKGSRVNITGRIGEISTFLPLSGTRQIENLSLAIAVLFELKPMGFYLDLEAIKTGIESTQLHGRFEVVSETPLIIFDCAHNEDSFQALENNLESFNIKDFFLVFGANEDKDISHCLKHIFPKAKSVFLVKSDNPRARDPQELMQAAQKYGGNTYISNSVAEGIQSAMQNAGSDTAIIITGSFFLWQKDWKV
jgi:dihydrofolate synthase/folylpolyglutamate synthase